jgi:hypothetical protein
MFGSGCGIPFSEGAGVGRYVEGLVTGLVSGCSEGGRTRLLSAHIVSALDSERHIVLQSPDWFLRTHYRSQAKVSFARGRKVELLCGKDVLVGMLLAARRIL